MDEVKEAINSQYHTTPSEPFRTILKIHRSLNNLKGRKLKPPLKNVEGRLLERYNNS
jgi:hypothetical protein